MSSSAHSGSLRKAHRVILIVAASAVFGWISWCLMRPQTPEPLFGGTPVNLRLRQFGALGMPSLGANEVARWTNSIHSNAIPYLVKALDERDAPLRKAYQSLWRILPSWISNHFPPPIYAVKMRGAAVFGLSVIGQDARAAIPQLIRLWKEEKDMGVRILVLRCLARIGEQDNRVTSAMIDSQKGCGSIGMARSRTSRRRACAD